MKRKSKGIFFSVTEKEKQKIKKNAALCGLNTSEYLRQRALGYAPRSVQTNAFFYFNQTLCRLCDEVADRVTPDTERRLLEVADLIQRQLLLPEKSSAKEVRKEVLMGSPRSLLRGEKEHPRSDSPIADSLAIDMSGV